MNFVKIIVVFILIIFVSCKNKQETKNKIDIPDWNQEKSTQLNKDLLFEEELRIEMFLEGKSNWKMTKTGSGLRYKIIKTTENEYAKAFKEAEINYSIQLLDGTFCYKTEEGTSITFVIDKSDVESGVQEALKLMRVGEKARLIVPSHLAHGLVGDMNKIPPLQSLIITIDIISVK